MDPNNSQPNQAPMQSPGQYAQSGPMPPQPYADPATSPYAQQPYGFQGGPPAGTAPNMPVAAGPQVPAPAGGPQAVPVRSNPNSTQNTLQIAEIRDGIVIMNDGTFRSVVMLKSINFDLMSQGEREAVEYSYQGFLNSLYFPIQIYVRSMKVDLGPYIQKLDKIRSEHDNMLLAYLMEDYIMFMTDIAQQTNIMDKKFYIVIPFEPTAGTQNPLAGGKGFISSLTGIFSPKEHHVTINESDLENAKTELRNRVQAILSGLSQCGVQGLPLDTQELIELYYDAYNPDTATRQQLKNFSDLTAPVITKGEGNAPQPNLDRELR